MKGGTFLIKKTRPPKTDQPYTYEYFSMDDNVTVNERGILETEIISLVFRSNNLTDILSTIYSGNIPMNTQHIEKFLHNFVLGQKNLSNGKSIVDLINELSKSERKEILKKYRLIIKLRRQHLRNMKRPGTPYYNNHENKLDQFIKFLESLEQGSKSSNTTKSTRKISNSKVRANTTRANTTRANTTNRRDPRAAEQDDNSPTPSSDKVLQRLQNFLGAPTNTTKANTSNSTTTNSTRANTSNSTRANTTNRSNRKSRKKSTKKTNKKN